MRNKHFPEFFALFLAMVLTVGTPLFACTGISLTAKDGSKVIGRTLEWGSFIMESHYVIVPRGHSYTSLTPSGMNGVKWTTRYGYVGIGVLEGNYLAEGINEEGLVGQLFYFPGYGKYEDYDPELNASTLSEVQFLDWVLGNFSTLEEFEKALGNVHVVSY